jgi:hypothetical protein
MRSEKQISKAEAPTDLDLSKTPLEEPEDGVFLAYSNMVNADWTLTDFRLRFGELIHVPNDEDPTWPNQRAVILERVAVTMPWHQAKYLATLLSAVIKNYEEINGELKPLKLPAAP